MLFLARKQVCVLNHPPYSPDLSPCDYFLFPKLKLPLKGRHFEDVQDIQGAVTSSLRAVPQEDVQRSFQSLLDRATRCIDLEGMYFEYNTDSTQVFCSSFVLEPPSYYIIVRLCTIIQTRIGVEISSPTRLITFRLFYWREVLILSGCVCNNYTVCPTCYRTRHFFNNSNTNEDIATKFEQEYVRCVRNEEECVCSVSL